MRLKAREQRGYSGVPLVPVMAAGTGVEFVIEASRMQNRGQFFVCGQQAFLLSTREKYVGNFRGIGIAGEGGWIIVAA